MVTIKDLSSVSNVDNSGNDVTEGRVFYGKLDWMSEFAVPTVCCKVHGAMNCVSLNDEGKIWRCFACHVAAFEPKESS